MLDGIKNKIWEIIKNAANELVTTIVMEKKDEWATELTEEINTTDSDWVKFRNAIYLSLIDKITAEKEA